MSSPIQNSDAASSPPWLIALTGASGTVYGLELIKKLLLETNECIELIVSDSALRVLREENNISLSSNFRTETLLTNLELESNFSARLEIVPNADIGARSASGSYQTKGMVVVPCSMNSLGAMASGLCSNLILRCAEVTLKEGRKLIIVPRETPLSPIALENMLKLSRLGVSVLPAMPGFYHQPTTIEQIIDFVVVKILDQMGIYKNSEVRWKSDYKAELQRQIGT